jgi:hypothetical protein
MNLEPSSVAGWMKPTSLRAIQGHASERKTAGQKPRRFVEEKVPGSEVSPRFPF